MITKDQAQILINQHLKSENLKKHCLAASVIMKRLAAKFGEPESDWEIIGLLHDLDFDLTRDNPEKHSRLTEEILSREDFPRNYLDAIVAHNEMTGMIRKEKLDFALACAESITGLIVACALVYPDKKITSVQPKSIKKRMKEKAFAKNVSRETIMECEKIGVPFDEFVDLSLAAMGEIQDRLI
ncbi:MAG: HD domain-containing protein [Candidatus Wallbacteria bacterium]|nr:HD domain-containing protein [Candidatus Wallbacteria bacterium]